MPNEQRADIPKTIWLNQPTEVNVTPQLIRRRSVELRGRTRRRLLGTLAGPAAAAFFYVFGTTQLAPLQEALQLLFAFALLWSLAGLYFLHKGMWSAEMPGDVALTAGLGLCLREMERQRDLLRRALLWSLGPTVLGLGAFIAALAMAGTRDRGMFPNGLPFLVLVFLWLAGYLVLRLRQQRELQREIDELHEIEKENRGLTPRP
jgi:hypothetical protein